MSQSCASSTTGIYESDDVTSNYQASLLAAGEAAVPMGYDEDSDKIFMPVLFTNRLCLPVYKRVRTPATWKNPATYEYAYPEENTSHHCLLWKSLEDFSYCHGEHAAQPSQNFPLVSELSPRPKTLHPRRTTAKGWGANAWKAPSIQDGRGNTATPSLCSISTTTDPNMSDQENVAPLDGAPSSRLAPLPQGHHIV